MDYQAIKKYNQVESFINSTDLITMYVPNNHNL